ncbi:MAG: hypothetical protein LBU15_03570, partial [Rickettsiales bacterium]|nr:hypothetical protein [Rickettsiales bacterium]
MPKDDVYGLFGDGENPVRSIEVRLVDPDPGLIKSSRRVRAMGPRHPDYYFFRSIPCELLITREDNLAAVKSGQYEGEVVTLDSLYVANDPEGCIRVGDGDGLFLYEGDVANGEMSGFAKITRKIPKSLGDGDDEHENCGRTVIFEGEVSHGLLHGYGKRIISDLSDCYVREGYFAKGAAVNTLLQKPGSTYPPELTSCDKEKGLMIRRVLSGDPARNWNHQIVFSAEGNVEGVRPLSEWRRQCQKDTTGEKLIKSLVIYYLYGDDETTLERAIEINYVGIVLALDGNGLENLEDLLTMGFLRDISEDKGIEGARPLVTFEAYRECLTKVVAQNFKIRFESGDATGVNSGQYELYLVMLLANMESIDELRRIRFSSEYFNPKDLKNVTSFLESIIMDEQSVLATTENYVSVYVSPGGHAAAVILDLEEMRKIVRDAGWNALNGTDTTLFYIYDSGAIFGSRYYGGKYEKVLDVIMKKGLRINMNVQELGSCWFYALAAQVTAMKNPHLVANLKSGGIKLHSLSKDGGLPEPSEGMGGQPEDLGDILNGFVAETLLTLHRIADAAGVNLPRRRLLVGHVVDHVFLQTIKVYFDNEVLAEFLGYRIRIVFGVFEAKFHRFSQCYRKILTEKHFEKFKIEAEKKDEDLKQSDISNEEAKNDRKLVNFLEKFRILEERCDRLEEDLASELTSSFSARNGGNAVCYYEHRDRNDGNIDRSLKVDYGKLNRLCSEHKIGSFSDLLEEILLGENAIEDVTGGTSEKLETPDEVTFYLSSCLEDLFIKNWAGGGLEPEKRTWLENNLRVLVALVNEPEPYHMGKINDIIFLEGNEQLSHSGSNVDP